MRKAAWVLAGVVLVLGFGTPPVRADRMGLPLHSVTLKENVRVFESGQRALIAWDGKMETMILSTDLRAEKPVQLLEVLPLPSKPDITEGSLDSFRKAAELIERNRPRAPAAGVMQAPTRSKGVERAEGPKVQVVLHRELGPHDVSVLVPDSANGFGRWVRQFVAKRGLRLDPKTLPRWDALVADYLGRGYRYFALDVVSLGPQTRTLTPLCYRFRTDHLYFALKVSSLFEGHTVVNLLLVTADRPNIWGTKTGLTAGFYGSQGTGAIPVKFMVQRRQIREIDHQLFRSAPAGRWCWFTAAHYAGSNRGLTRDFVMRPTAPMPPAARLTRSASSGGKRRLVLPVD